MGEGDSGSEKIAACSGDEVGDGDSCSNGTDRLADFSGEEIELRLKLNATNR